jgi:tRNA U55 pseudouridine synthase TruB
MVTMDRWRGEVMRAPPMSPAVEVDGERAELDYPARGKCNRGGRGITLEDVGVWWWQTGGEVRR